MTKNSIKLKNNLIERNILTILSMNGRAPLSFIKDRIGITKYPTYRRIKQLEEKYSISYTAEVDTKSLGYMCFLILIRFIKKVPITSDLDKIFQSEPRIQTAFVLNGGDYHLMLSMFVDSESEINDIRRKLMKTTLLIDYPAEWFITPFYDTYGFIPLRPDFIDMIKERSKLKTIGIRPNLTENQSKIIDREFSVLKELNSNGTISFSDIDKKYGFDRGRSQYSYYKLMQKGILKRVTINMQPEEALYPAIVFMKIIDYKKFNRHRNYLSNAIIKESGRSMNRYLLVGDIWMPFTAIFIFNVFGDELDRITKELSKIKGTEIKAAVISKILLGSLCCRLFDNSYSIQQSNLEALDNAVKAERIDYFSR